MNVFKEKYLILLTYFDKQIVILDKLFKEIINLNLNNYGDQYVFATKTQQLYTAIEDLFKQIAKAFENHIDDLKNFHREILKRMSLEIIKIRPAVISNESLPLLDELRAFRHFFRHAYDYELSENRLQIIKNELEKKFSIVKNDLNRFRSFIQKLTE